MSYVVTRKIITTDYALRNHQDGEIPDQAFSACNLFDTLMFDKHPTLIYHAYGRAFLTSVWGPAASRNFAWVGDNGKQSLPLSPIQAWGAVLRNLGLPSQQSRCIQYQEVVDDKHC
ncbi:hypothetical protein EYB53_015715 [Candidatus Chloroploca sp. M-50]|uniref:Uncharacterized protein n=1 Tax=Candidatus Chloroploca mongolica TaxID=2528176 RepID=A0ABS4DCJ2_9CHLR|nr:hypothetical protein [Candidatus Chloroploca mongolica]MBP1467161.1 hypothetical protein [Candidatus Chloroploca mongolica]